MKTWVLAAFTALIALAISPPAKAELVMRAALLEVTGERPLPISRLDLPIGDEGLKGARQALADNNTTGQFLGQTYELVEMRTARDGLGQALADIVDQGIGVVIAMASAEDLLFIADQPEAADLLILNAQAYDDRLRGNDCRANVLHIAPSRAQLADGLAQYMVWKRWTEWLMVRGDYPEDVLMADAYRRAATKFGIEVVEELVFEDTGGARRTDSGHVLVQKQIPVFMQRAEDHDVVVAADENEVFAAYLPYRGWTPRPVAGDAGLVTRIWHPSFEGWGATQLQRRFEKTQGRRMTDADYLAWLAFRVIGEAVTRTGSSDVAALRAYILSEEFEIAGFKGQALSFRPWNNQMRHGILLANGAMVITVSPQAEFLHQKTRLDTLGFDEPESACEF